MGIHAGTATLDTDGARRWTLTSAAFIVLAAAVDTVLYHVPLLSFAVRSLDVSTADGVLTLVTMPVVVFLETALLLVLIALVSHRLLKPFCVVFAVANSIAVYFIASYGVVLDVTMMGNVFNTNFAESSEFFGPALITYVLALGVLPAWLVARVRIVPSPRLRLVAGGAAGVLITVAWAWLSASTWLWIDKHSKQLGGMVLPWSYVINAARYQVPRIWTSGSPELLPPATFAPAGKTVVVLVIGEAARAANFSLYGYKRPTNPLLADAGVVALRNATSCATYTSAAVRCMLSNADTERAFGTRYEPLTSYLQRNGVDVTWRTRNFGEPPMTVRSFRKAAELAAGCTDERCKYDEVLLSGLERELSTTTNPRTFVVIHQMGSHGPAYSTRYPPEFERFLPTCKSVELSRCSGQELLNAYDNTIVYEDYFLARTIRVLAALPNTSTLLIYMSDHGESLGEYGLYLHGVPFGIAPDVQTRVPFIVWMSAEFMRQKGLQPHDLALQSAHSQRDIFHSVMGAFSMRSAAYEPAHDIFNRAYANR